jgi:hypothetical protein
MQALRHLTVAKGWMRKAGIHRLETIEPQLADAFRKLDSRTRRNIVARAINEANSRVRIDDPCLSIAIMGLSDGCPVGSEVIAQLNSMRDTLDEKYFALQEKAASPAERHEYMVAFSQARLVSAVAFGCENDSIVNAMDAIYEALMAVDDRGPIVTRLRAAIGT